MMRCTAVVHPDRPVNNKFVRVTDYNSRMVIKPHNSFTQVATY